jgi:hypothetical protein
MKIKINHSKKFYFNHFYYFMNKKDIEPDFEHRQVQIRKEKWVTDEFDMLEFLGRYVFNLLSTFEKQNVFSTKSKIY